MAGPSRPLPARILSEAFSPDRPFPAGNGAPNEVLTRLQIRFASTPLPQGRRRQVAGRWPRVTGLTSCLSGCVDVCSGVIPFGGAASSRRLTDFSRSAHSPRFRRPCALRSLEQSLVMGWTHRTAELRSGFRSSNHYLLVTASVHRSKRPVSSTRLSTVSNRTLPHSS
jgi:hypothetical protein